VTPKVAVGFFVDNGQRFLPWAIEAILAQTFRDLDLIISDNASTDTTAEICRDAAGRDPRVRYVRQAKNEGAVANCNRLFALARSPYFKWAADDNTFWGRSSSSGTAPSSTPSGPSSSASRKLG
jgi:glycosyltransferase involved in cell wall biosynthesis